MELKRSCKVAAKYCFFLQLFGMWMTFMFLVPGCDDIKVPDVRMTRYTNVKPFIRPELICRPNFTWLCYCVSVADLGCVKLNYHGLLCVYIHFQKTKSTSKANGLNPVVSLNVCKCRSSRLVYWYSHEKDCFCCR